MQTGTIGKRDELQWQAKIRRKGFPVQSRIFMYKEDAEKWIRATEHEPETSGFIDRREAKKDSLAEVLKRYKCEITASKKSASIESIKIDVILRDPTLRKLKMSAITSTAIAAWRKRRLSNMLELSAVTGHKDLRMLTHYYHSRA